MGAPMLSPLIHSVLRIVGRMTDQERRETVEILQSADHALENIQAIQEVKRVRKAKPFGWVEGHDGVEQNA